MKNIKHILDLMQKNEMKKNLEQIKWQAFQQWLRKNLIGDTPGVPDGLYKSGTGMSLAPNEILLKLPGFIHRKTPARETE